MTVERAETPKRSRSIAHYFLIAVAIFYFWEAFVFFSEATSTSGNPVATRYLLLTIVVFGTAAAATIAFIKALASPLLIAFGLLFIQLAFNLGIDAITNRKLNLSNGLLGGGAGFIFLAVAIKNEISLRGRIEAAAKK